MKSSIGRLRAIGMVEGVSFLFLLGIAMPLKYIAGNPLAVKYGGWVHGILFMLLCLALLDAKLTHRWSMTKALKPFVASLLPFGPFLIDRGLKEDQEATAAGDGE